MYPSIAITSPILIWATLFSIIFATCQSHVCNEQFLSFTKARNMTHCYKLATLGAELGWSLKNHTTYIELDIIFGARLETGWLAWGVNPDKRPRMVGTKAVIGILHPNGSSICKTYNITEETKLGCQLLPSDIDEVKYMSFEFVRSTDYHTIFAKLNLSTAVYNVSRLSVVWQIGYNAEGNEPKKHHAALQNVDSTDILDLVHFRSYTNAHRLHRLRNVHGVLSIAGWGTLLPIGVIIARYFKTDHPLGCKLWTYFHISCQVLGYLLGVSGWAIGLWLGHESRYYSFRNHRLFAIFIFTFTTLQMLSLRWRPKKTDNYRQFWNVYHHLLGYGLLAVIIINIFKGIAILKPENYYWKSAYIGILAIFGALLLVLEILSWAKFRMSRSKDLTKLKETPPSKTGGDSNSETHEQK